MPRALRSVSSAAIGLSVSAACWVWFSFRLLWASQVSVFWTPSPPWKSCHEADAALDEPARHQALAPERLGDRLVEAVELPGGL